MRESTVYGLHKGLVAMPVKGSSYFRYYSDASKHFDRSRKSGKFKHLSLNVYTFKNNITMYTMIKTTNWPTTAATIKSWSKSND